MQDGDVVRARAEDLELERVERELVARVDVDRDVNVTLREADGVAVEYLVHELVRLVLVRSEVKLEIVLIGERVVVESFEVLLHE